MSKIYKIQHRAYLQAKYKLCTYCKKELKLFTTTEFLPINKGDYQLRPFCLDCADRVWQLHSAS